MKHDTEAEELDVSLIGRGALHTRGSSTVRSCGVYGRENAGMSSESKVRILTAEYLRFQSKADLLWVSRDLRRGREA